ncbi:hypothetical protein GCM10022224_068570 [Nonomuraea antimicrobica]|uniref:Helix-turn-helix domain-containing protein n=1 Tax=Nonomuraea antimicrobica TaxID=561173 RepID=A0ABP7CRG3_9ACTN
MGAQSRAEELGRLLREIKGRSGRSYEWIGRRINASKSTVHRYCSGEIIPPNFATVEQIALACRADRADLVRLHRLWILATAEAEETDDPPPGSHPPAEPVRSEPPRRGPFWQGSRHAATWAGVGLVLVSLLISQVGSSPPLTAARGQAQQITGPSWALPPAPVPHTLFGVTVNSATGDMPSFRVGAVRLWDSATRWSQIQRARGKYDWATLDRLVTGAERSRLPVLFVFGGTPGWASPDGPPAPYPDGARAAPPDDLKDWEAFVRATVRRYTGRIEAYELWVLGNDDRFFNGDLGTLAEMTRRASRIIRAADPDADVVCPGMGQLWSHEGRDAMRRFAELGGYAHCDVASVKLHQRSASEPPETMLELADVAYKVLHEAGAHPPLWSTGTTYMLPLDRPLDALTARDFAVRYFLAGIYARDLNLERMYFYNWGGTKLPLVLQAVGGEPTEAALAVERLQGWLAEARSRSCGQGSAIGMPANVWRCEFLVTDAGNTRRAAVVWSIGGMAKTTVREAAELRRLDGTSRRLRPLEVVTFGEDPVYVEYLGVP